VMIVTVGALTSRGSMVASPATFGGVRKVSALTSDAQKVEPIPAGVGAMVTLFKGRTNAAWRGPAGEVKPPPAEVRRASPSPS
jgi:hypothetical protein